MGHGTLKLWCYELFDRFQRYVEIVRKVMKKRYNSFIRQFNDIKSTGKV